MASILSQNENLYVATKIIGLIRRKIRMDQIKNLLEARKEYLQQLINEKEEALIGVPSGLLRICKGRNKVQYYYRTNPKDFSGVYISEKDYELAKALAQKSYDKKVLTSAQKELKAVDSYISSFQETQAEEIYEKLHQERRKLIEPIRETDEQYILNWQNVQYLGKEFDDGLPEIYTEKGERVRSKSELIIADLLEREGIPYRYEYPVKIKGWGKFYPDFTALNVRKRKEIYWEHLGMMDDAAYVENTLQKIALYEQNGMFPNDNLILTYETKKNPINPKIVRLMINQYLK